MNSSTLYPLLRALLCLVTLAMLSSVGLIAQTVADDECAAGRRFVIALPDTVVNAFDNRFPPTEDESFVMFIYSESSQTVRINRLNGSTVMQPVGAREMVEFDMRSLSVPFVGRSNVASSAALNVEADNPIIIYVYVSTHFGSAAFTPLPVERWGTEYRAAAWPGGYVRNIVPAGETNFDATTKVPAPAEIVVVAAYDDTRVAAYDDTRVTIEPTGPLSNCVMCSAVTLQAGEAYQVRSFVDTNEGIESQSDLAGTRITADKPIGVLSGNTRTSIVPPTLPMLAGNSIKDLMVEWLRPTTSHGTTFVVMPTADQMFPSPHADPAREAEYARIIPSNADETTVTVIGRDTSGTPQEIAGSPVPLDGAVTDTMNGFDAAVAYVTSDPAALYHSPKPVPKYNGTVGGGGGFIDVSYHSWGSFLVEATPREQWTSFAPFRAPTAPTTMHHYLNLVTDTASSYSVYVRQGRSPRQRFLFNRGRIPGTDLVWGSIAINPGVTYLIEGEEEARFAGYVYGYRRGYERFRPSGTQEEKRSGAAALHPSEYEEETGQYYAYPLASGHCSLREAPGFQSEVTEQGCGIRLVTTRLTGDDAFGIGSVTLDDTSSFPNTRLEFVTPSDSSRLSSEMITEVVVRLSPIDPRNPAQATLLFREKGVAGIAGALPYRYDPAPLKADPTGAIVFDDLIEGRESAEKSVTLRNGSGGDLTVRDIDLAGGLNGFRIVRTVPTVDFANGESITLADEETLVLIVDVTASIDDGIIRDTIVVDHSCGRLTVAMSGTVEPACLRLNDLDFGTVRRGERRTMPLRICNDGPGRASFPDSGEIISWLGSEFGVSAADLARLRGTVLDSGACIMIDVNFLVTEELGQFRTTAQIRSNGSGCRDTSVWLARVDTISSVDDPSSVSGMTVTPNPAGDELTVGFTLERASDLRIVLHDAAGRKVATLDAGRLSAGPHRLPLDLSMLPSGVYLLRVGDLSERLVVVR